MAEFNKIFDKIDQIGCVVQDLDKVRAGMKLLFGVDPQGGGVYDYKNVTVKGKVGDCSVEVILYDFFGLQLEFMSPVSGESTWQDFVDNKGDGIHHIRFDVPSHDDAMKVMADRGVEAYQHGESIRGGGVKYAYFDTVPHLGFMLETLNLREVAKDE